MVWPSFIRPYSEAIGSFTLTIMSARDQTSAAFSTIFAPAVSYALSGIPLPTPACFSISTVWPRPVSAATPPGTRPTRYSRVFTSVGQPMIIAGSVVQACEKGPRKIAGRSPLVESMLKLLFADERGQVYEHPELLALVRGGLPGELPVPLPPHATL